MRMPTPVHELPSYKARELSKSQSGDYNWVPYVIIGGLLVIGYLALRDMEIKNTLPNFNIKDVEDE